MVWWWCGGGGGGGSVVVRWIGAVVCNGGIDWWAVVA